MIVFWNAIIALWLLCHIQIQLLHCYDSIHLLVQSKLHVDIPCSKSECIQQNCLHTSHIWVLQWKTKHSIQEKAVPSVHGCNLCFTSKDDWPLSWCSSIKSPSSLVQIWQIKSSVVKSICCMLSSFHPALSAKTLVLIYTDSLLASMAKKDAVRAELDNVLWLLSPQGTVCAPFSKGFWSSCLSLLKVWFTWEWEYSSARTCSKNNFEYGAWFFITQGNSKSAKQGWQIALRQ